MKAGCDLAIWRPHNLLIPASQLKRSKTRNTIMAQYSTTQHSNSAAQHSNREQQPHLVKPASASLCNRTLSVHVSRDCGVRCTWCSRSHTEENNDATSDLHGKSSVTSCMFLFCSRKNKVGKGDTIQDGFNSVSITLFHPISLRSILFHSISFHFCQFYFISFRSIPSHQPIRYKNQPISPGAHTHTQKRIQR